MRVSLLVDRYGVVPCSLLFNTCMLVGMVIFAIAPAEPEFVLDGTGVLHHRASAHSMLYLLTGRLLLGIGGECLCAAASAALARWFRASSWLTFATGFNQAFVSGTIVACSCRLRDELLLIVRVL